MMLAKVLKYVCPNLEFPSVKLLISLSETFPKTQDKAHARPEEIVRTL